MPEVVTLTARRGVPKAGLVTGVKSEQGSRTGRCGWITSFLRSEWRPTTDERSVAIGAPFLWITDYSSTRMSSPLGGTWVASVASVMTESVANASGVCGHTV